MASPSFDARRRGLLQQFVPLDLSTHWEVPQVVKAKSFRWLVLAGNSDFVAYDLSFRQPHGVIEITGTRAGNYATTLLAVFTSHRDEDVPRFVLGESHALGTLILSLEAFAGVVQMLGSPAVYIRLGGNGEHNAIASDLTLLQ